MIVSWIKTLVGRPDYRFYLPVLLDFLKAIAWPFIVLVAGFLFHKKIGALIDRIKTFEGAGIKAVFGSDQGINTQSPQIQATAAAPPKASLFTLLKLLSQYQYVGVSWAGDLSHCFTARFSHQYSGGETRYVDRYFRELDDFLRNNSLDAYRPIKQKANELKVMLEEILPYHRGGEHLSAPIFDYIRYQTLMNDLAQKIKVELDLGN